MKNRVEKRLIVAIAVVCVFYLVAGLIYKPIVCNDAINGMLSLHNYLNGGGWNKYFQLSADNLQVMPSELTWWAPGQYAIPYLLSKLIFINIGTAITLLMFLSTAGGCYFYYQLFKLSGIKSAIVLWALLILLLERFINVFFIQYTSPDLLLFFYTPFYLYTYYKLTKAGARLFFTALLLTGLNMFGVYIKNSFILFEVAFNVFLIAEYLFLNPARLKNNFTGLFKISSLWIILPFMVANVINYYFFLRLGANPANGSAFIFNVSVILYGVFLPVMGALFASVSLSGIYGNVYEKIHLSILTADMLMLAILLLVVLIAYRKKTFLVSWFKTDRLLRFVTVGFVMYILFWLVFTIKQSAVSNEDRLYLPITILVFPYLLSFALSVRWQFRYVYFALIVLSVFYSMVSFAYRIKKYNNDGSVFSKNIWLKGFKVYSDNQHSEADLKNISAFIAAKLPGYYVVVPNPNLAFELNVPNKIFVNSYITGYLKTNRPLNCVMVQTGAPLPGFTKIGSSGRFSVYKIN